MNFVIYHCYDTSDDIEWYSFQTGRKKGLSARIISVMPSNC